jgi:hypothetical protein
MQNNSQSKKSKCWTSCTWITYILGSLSVWLAVTGQEKSKKMLFWAALLSGIWVYWYGYDYKSSQDDMRIGRFNLFTWISWTIGLMAVGFFYNYIKRETSLTLTQRVVFTGVLWVISVMIIEWIGYNKMGIQLKSNEVGLFGLDLMHGPWYLKIYYLTAWALFLSILNVW